MCTVVINAHERPIYTGLNCAEIADRSYLKYSELCHNKLFQLLWWCWSNWYMHMKHNSSENAQWWTKITHITLDHAFIVRPSKPTIISRIQYMSNIISWKAVTCPNSFPALSIRHTRSRFDWIGLRTSSVQINALKMEPLLNKPIWRQPDFCCLFHF